MLKALAPFALTLALALVGTVSHAADCPVTFGDEDYLGGVADAINKAPSCYAGADIAESCALGASGDSFTTAAAIDKCDAEVAGKLSKDEMVQYNSLSQKCTDKYANQDGTLYISMAAFCRLNVSKLYNQLYTPVESAE